MVWDERRLRSPSPVGENPLPRSENLSASRGRNRGTHMVQVIPEKITPPIELPRVSRERLLATLFESLEGCNSMIIHGRAGTGKTMLAGTSTASGRNSRAPSSSTTAPRAYDEAGVEITRTELLEERGLLAL